MDVSPFERRRPRAAVSSDSTGKMEVQIPAGHFLMGDTQDKKRACTQGLSRCVLG